MYTNLQVVSETQQQKKNNYTEITKKYCVICGHLTHSIFNFFLSTIYKKNFVST